MIFVIIDYIIIFLLARESFWQISAISISLRSRIHPFSVFASFVNCQEGINFQNLNTENYNTKKGLIWIKNKGGAHAIAQKPFS